MKKNIISLVIIIFLLTTVRAQERKISGKVVDTDGLPIAGATISLKQEKLLTKTALDGTFSIPTSALVKVTLSVSCIGYETREITDTNFQDIVITLSPSNTQLDEVIIQAYGTTSRRLNTGNISKIAASEISKQPVSNPLLALQGRVSGLQITQSSGLPGSNIIVQLRGDNSLENGKRPLYIIDGVPFMLNNGTSLSAQISPVIIQSPLNSISPTDIESIEILKDAEATAIYGSQGANGVILITTKSGKSGKTQWDINYYSGVGRVSRSVDILNTREYLEMRHEAFENDNLSATNSNAPDLLLWDTTKYTDWKNYFIGGSARIHNVQTSLSGGSNTTKFLLSGTFNTETTVFPKSKPNERSSISFKLLHESVNHKFKSQFSTSYSIDDKKLPIRDMTSYIFLAPNSPDLYNAQGRLNWTDGLDNPMSFLAQDFNSNTRNLIMNARAEYLVAKGLAVKVNTGFNQMDFNERIIIPISAQRPSALQQPTGTSTKANSNLNGWIVEPQLEYIANIFSGKFTALTGASIQSRRQERLIITASDFVNDDLLGMFSAAPRLSISNNESVYKYTALFGRLNYNYNNKYLFSINGRRDGSSRFGPSSRFSNFGAASAAWIFSDEDFFAGSVPYISYGKLRASYGVTGNDQIDDYQFIDLWSASSNYRYQGITGVLQERLFNPYLEWERTKKMELGLDIGVLNNRVFIASAYYQNKSDNQLISYSLPTQTGFNSVKRNLDALIVNAGWEFDISVTAIDKASLFWSSTFNVSFPKNRLLRYPGLETSSDKNSYMIGQPLRILRKYNYYGVDKTTGNYSFEDVNGDGSLNSTNDYLFIGATGARYFGGWQNTFRIKNLQISFLFEFKKQNDQFNFLSTAPGIFNGTYANQPSHVMNRWANDGNQSSVQRFTASTGSDTYRAYTQFRNSSATFVDASFIRFKNIDVSYILAGKLIKKAGIQKARIFLQGQNIATISRNTSLDPETNSLLSLPPLTILTVGINLSF